jgi:hypothetical protein
MLLAGSFAPTAETATVSVAPHFQNETPVFVRFSNFAGVPVAADNDPNQSSPRGNRGQAMGQATFLDRKMPLRSPANASQQIRRYRRRPPAVPRPLQRWLSQSKNVARPLFPSLFPPTATKHNENEAETIQTP